MSKIEWTDETWNPTTGCTKVSTGCANCYAERMAKRQRGRNGYPADDPFRLTLRTDRLEDPFRWQAPRRVFVNSMSDLFHDQVSYEFIDRVFAVMALCGRHTFQVLTKRPARMLTYLESRSASADYWKQAVPAGRSLEWESDGQLFSLVSFPLPNVWLGVSAENQKTLDERVPLLLSTPAAIRFVSAEPLLGPLDLRARPKSDLCIRCGEGPAGRHDHPDGYRTRGLDWIIVGAESGPGRRACAIEWVRAIIDTCDRAGVAVFVKQIQVGDRRDVVKDPEKAGLAYGAELLRRRAYPVAVSRC